MDCKNCGASIKRQSISCSYCGSDVEGSASSDIPNSPPLPAAEEKSKAQGHATQPRDYYQPEDSYSRNKQESSSGGCLSVFVWFAILLFILFALASIFEKGTESKVSSETSEQVFPVKPEPVITDNLKETESIAFEAVNKGDYEKALPLFTMLSSRGKSRSQNSLGYMYQNGLGVSQDYQEAVKWYRESSKHGNSAAKYNLGHMYQNGLGVIQDYPEAIKLYRASAKMGESSAQNNLGVMYQDGLGVPVDLQKAQYWFELAAAQGNPMARNNLDSLLKLIEQ